MNNTVLGVNVQRHSDSFFSIRSAFRGLDVISTVPRGLDVISTVFRDVVARVTIPLDRRALDVWTCWRRAFGIPQVSLWRSTMQILATRPEATHDGALGVRRLWNVY